MVTKTWMQEKFINAYGTPNFQGATNKTTRYISPTD